MTKESWVIAEGMSRSDLKKQLCDAGLLSNGIACLACESECAFGRCYTREKPGEPGKAEKFVKGNGTQRVERGLQMEAEGKSNAEIAQALGYRTEQSWYAAKSYYRRKRKDPSGKSKIVLLNKEDAAEKTEPACIHPPQSLKIKMEFLAEGQLMKYRYSGGNVTIQSLDGHGGIITLTEDELIVMIQELGDLFRRVRKEAPP